MDRSGVKVKFIELIFLLLYPDHEMDLPIQNEKWSLSAFRKFKTIIVLLFYVILFGSFYSFHKVYYLICSNKNFKNNTHKNDIFVENWIQYDDIHILFSLS